MPDDPSTEILPASAERAAVQAAAPELIGRVLGKFTVIERLGKGGSGEVFRAEQTQLGRSAVIKVLRHEIASAPNRVERFLREAKLASRLDHPYAAHIYAFGAEPDAVLWIAMEHVKGMTLDELVARRGAMPASVFAPLFARLCEVVHSAHELGIIHRDIKASNVMVIERAGQLLPKLLDFGIAKSEDAVITPGIVADSGELTGHGVTLGSPHYMSPEQWERPADVDARADIYALGVLAYRCVAGWLPFHASDRHQLVEAHLSQTPPPLPDFVPTALADVILRALAKSPDARWQSALSFGEAVNRAVGTTPPEAVPIFDPATRDAWLRGGPQPIADAIAHLTSATTTVEADAALREVVAITCRWLAVLSLASLAPQNGANPKVRDSARAVIGRDDSTPWLRLARDAAAATTVLPGLAAALAGCEPLAQLADRLDDRDRPRTAAALANDVVAVADALRPLEPLLAYQLVVGRAGGVAESWQGARRRDRERVMVWGVPLADGEVALLDASGQVVAKLSPLAQVAAPLPSAEPELFLLWRGGRGSARMMAAPWGFERDDDAAGAKLALLSTEDSDTSAEPDDRSPYPGLAAYTADDAERFVGREREIEAIANRLVRTPLLAVLGPSGVGKSSFIAAGLLPRLREQRRILVMRPGRHPMHALAALPPVSSDSQDESALVARLRELGESAQQGLVIVVDQLEELVTLANATERRKFAETLAAVADGPGAPVRVVATLRDDFATVIESEDAFRGKFEVFVLAAPAPEALRRIVVEPARRSAVTVDPKVVDDMVAEIAGRPASLPLLSFTASQLWRTRDKAARRIRHDAYLAIGGVAGALATYADQLYGSLARRDQETVRELFGRLVAADGTRIPAPRTELEQLPGARAVLAHLVDARLLVVRDDDGTDVIEIVHECLAERWPRLARWRTEDAADRALIADVHAAARRWSEGGRSPDLLWRGEALAELRRLSARSTGLTELEREFADAALSAQQRARRMRRGIVAAAMILLAGIAATMAYLGAVANDNRAQAERNAQQARASETIAEAQLTSNLIAQGKRELNDNRAFEALAYFRAAMERGADSQGLRAMITVASRAWRDTLLVFRKEPMSYAVGSPNGWIAAAAREGKVYFFDDSGKQTGELESKTGPNSTMQIFADDSITVLGRDGIALVDAKRQMLANFKPKASAWIAHVGPGTDELCVVEDGGLRVYGRDGTLRREFPLDRSMNELMPIFTYDGKRAIYTRGETVYMVDLTAMTQRVIATDAGGQATGPEEGMVFGYIDKKHRVRLIDPDGKLGATLEVPGRAVSFWFSDTGKRIAVGTDHDMTIFDDKGKEVGSFETDPEHQTFVIDDDDNAWGGGPDGVIKHYRQGKLVASLPLHPTEINLAFRARNALVTIGSDGALTISRADARQLVVDPEPCPGPVSYGAVGISASYECGGTIHVYWGRRKLGEYPVSDFQIHSDVDPVSGNAVLSSASPGRGTRVFDNTGKLIAQTDKKAMVMFDDSAHLFVLERGVALWRWELARDQWEKLMPIGDVYTLGAIPGVALLADERIVTAIAGGKPIGKFELAERTAFFTASPDHRWVAAQLESGATAIVDTTTWQVVRSLATSDALAGAATFDASGELLLRASRGAMTIWERATGENLVFGFDLLRNLANARFLPDGRIETDARTTGLVDLPRDMRPISEIIADIKCRVPLEVTSSRLQPATTTCP